MLSPNNHTTIVSLCEGVLHIVTLLVNPRDATVFPYTVASHMLAYSTLVSIYEGSFRLFLGFCILNFAQLF